jgi:guanine deaminase
VKLGGRAPGTLLVRWYEGPAVAVFAILAQQLFLGHISVSWNTCDLVHISSKPLPILRSHVSTMNPNIAQESLDTLPLAYHGTIIHSISLTELEILEKGLLVLSTSGKILQIEKHIEPHDIDNTLRKYGLSPSRTSIHRLSRGEFLLPGFIDTHNHAPQWTQRGLGKGVPLMTWLNDTTFPHEAKFADAAYAKRTYASCVSGFLNQGITTAAYYGSLHGEATKILAQTCLEKGQRALVGKCNMDRHSPDYYRDTSAQESLRVTEQFITSVREMDPQGKTVVPILTPRFAISCSPDLMTGLGELASQNPDLPIQTHFNESVQEIEVTRGLFPEFDNEADLYTHFGLLTSRTILAHCIFLSEYEKKRVKEVGCSVSHCPVSVTTGEGFLVAPIRDYLRRGIKVGLGTDSGGGSTASMLEVMRQAFVVSNAQRSATGGQDTTLTLEELLYLATLGGAKVCGLDGKVGNFEVGKEFDALEIRTVGPHAGVITPVEDEDGTGVVLEKFLMTGDDRNIARVYVGGRLVKS